MEVLELLYEQIIDELETNNIFYFNVVNNKSYSKYIRLLKSGRIIRVSDHIGKFNILSINVKSKRKQYRKLQRYITRELKLYQNKPMNKVFDTNWFNC